MPGRRRRTDVPVPVGMELEFEIDVHQPEGVEPIGPRTGSFRVNFPTPGPCAPCAYAYQECLGGCHQNPRCQCATTRAHPMCTNCSLGSGTIPYLPPNPPNMDPGVQTFEVCGQCGCPVDLLGFAFCAFKERFPSETRDYGEEQDGDDEADDGDDDAPQEFVYQGSVEGHGYPHDPELQEARAHRQSHEWRKRFAEKMNREHQRERMMSNREKRKKTPEVVTTNTVPLPTEDVDELVSMIEGTKLQNSKKNGTKDTNQGASNSAKKEKKERQREKKRLEEEALKKAEEDRLRQEEEERLRVEQEQREEELRKKREKKKKRKIKKKNEGKEEDGTGLTVEVGGSVPLKLAPVMPVGTEQPSSSKSSEMVTIRRHASANDTTVTISLKSETGNENLLYTLVNGQVYSDKKTNGKGPTPPTQDLSKGKAKNKSRQDVPPPEVTITSSGESDGYDPMPPPGAGRYDADANMIVMNPDRDEADDDSYNSDEYFYMGKQRAGEFETVVSSKHKRKRSKANKADEAEGNGSSERGTSREQTPGPSGNGSSVPRIKLASDSGMKNSSVLTTDRRDGRRGSDSTNRNGIGSTKAKGESHSGSSARKSSREQRTPNRQDGKQERGSAIRRRRYGKSDQPVPSQSYARPHASPVLFQAQSPGFGEIYPPMPKITPLNSVKMADVVSGNHTRTNRDTPEPLVQVVGPVEGIPASRKSIPSQTSLHTFANTIRMGELDISFGQSSSPTNQAPTDASGSNAPFTVPATAGNYNMWRGNVVSPEDRDFLSGVHAKVRAASISTDPVIPKPGIWTWSAEDESLLPSQGPAIRRPPPPQIPGPSSGFRASPIGLNFGTIDGNLGNPKFQFNHDLHSQPHQLSANAQVFVSKRPVPGQSPLQFMSRPQLNSSPALNSSGPPHPVGQYASTRYENYYSHGESGLPQSETRDPSNGIPSYFSAQSGIQVPHQLSNPGGASQTCPRRPMPDNTQCPSTFGLSQFGFSSQRRSSSETGHPIGTILGYPPTPQSTSPYSFRPISQTNSQESPTNVDRPTASRSPQYSLF